MNTHQLLLNITEGLESHANEVLQAQGFVPDTDYYWEFGTLRVEDPEIGQRMADILNTEIPSSSAVYDQAEGGIVFGRRFNRRYVTAPTPGFRESANIASAQESKPERCWNCHSMKLTKMQRGKYRCDVCGKTSSVTEHGTLALLRQVTEGGIVINHPPIPDGLALCPQCGGDCCVPIEEPPYFMSCYHCGETGYVDASELPAEGEPGDTPAPAKWHDDSSYAAAQGDTPDEREGTPADTEVAATVIPPEPDPEEVPF